MWVLFHVPCPTPDGQTAKDLDEKCIPWITAELQASAVRHGGRFHRAWYARDDSAFYTLANWESGEGANAFFDEWDITDVGTTRVWKVPLFWCFGVVLPSGHPSECAETPHNSVPHISLMSVASRIVSMKYSSSVSAKVLTAALKTLA